MCYELRISTFLGVRLCIFKPAMLVGISLSCLVDDQGDNIKGDGFYVVHAAIAKFESKQREQHEQRKSHYLEPQ